MVVVASPVNRSDRPGGRCMGIYKLIAADQEQGVRGNDEGWMDRPRNVMEDYKCGYTS